MYYAQNTHFSDFYFEHGKSDKGPLQKQKAYRNLQRKYQPQNDYSMVVQKNQKMYYGASSLHDQLTLTPPNSGVSLLVPEVTATILCHIHTSPSAFLHIIPDSECLIGPIPEFHSTIHRANKLPPNTWYTIKIPHCIRKKDKLKYIRVRHGDIHKSSQFSLVPFHTTDPKTIDANIDSYYCTDTQYVTIHTRHFSQFICTTCEKICDGKAKAFLFGSHLPVEVPFMITNVRVYVCSPLYEIEDYRKVIIIYLL